MTLSLKWSRSTQGHNLKKAPWHRHTTTWYKFCSILKLLLFPSFCTSSRKIPSLIIYEIFLNFIHVYKAPGQEETTFRDNFFLCKQKCLNTLITGCMFQKIALLSDFMHIFHDFIPVHRPWAGADNPLGPNFLCQLEGLITTVICCKFKKNIFNL